jgi:hypothetical protein
MSKTDPTQRLGIMNSKPNAGECFAAYADDPGHTEAVNLAAQPAPDFEVDQRLSW